MLFVYALSSDADFPPSMVSFFCQRFFAGFRWRAHTAFLEGGGFLLSRNKALCGLPCANPTHAFPLLFTPSFTPSLSRTLPPPSFKPVWARNDRPDRGVQSSLLFLFPAFLSTFSGTASRCKTFLRNLTRPFAPLPPINGRFGRLFFSKPFSFYSPTSP